MSLDDTLEQTQISFKEPLTIKGVRLLFKSLASHFKCTISYNLESLGKIDGSSEKFESEEYFSKIGGRIDKLEDKKLAMVQFGFEKDYIGEEKKPYFTKLMFELPPGYTLEEVSPENSKLITGIREYLLKQMNQ